MLGFVRLPFNLFSFVLNVPILKLVTVVLVTLPNLKFISTANCFVTMFCNNLFCYALRIVVFMDDYCVTFQQLRISFCPRILQLSNFYLFLFFLFFFFSISSFSIILVAIGLTILFRGYQCFEIFGYWAASKAVI